VTTTDEKAGGEGGLATSARLLSLPSRLLGLVAMYSDRLANQRLARAGARKWHYAVLVTLRDFGPASQSMLSQRTGIYRSDLVAVINELSERDFVRRVPDPDDHRRNVVTMTPQGRRHLRRLDALVDSLEEDLLSPLAHDEREELTQLLRRLLDHHALISSPPPPAE
jgi:DNA-binding MarR family transcriptional regulator